MPSLPSEILFLKITFWHKLLYKWKVKFALILVNITYNHDSNQLLSKVDNFGSYGMGWKLNSSLSQTYEILILFLFVTFPSMYHNQKCVTLNTVVFCSNICSGCLLYSKQCQYLTASTLLTNIHNNYNMPPPRHIQDTNMTHATTQANTNTFKPNSVMDYLALWGINTNTP